jgi:hypothetical protein
MSKTRADKINRTTAVVAFGIALALIATIALLTPNAGGGDIPTPPSTFFASDSGAKAIYLVLQRLLPDTRQWRMPLTELEHDSDARRATLIVMGPPAPLSEREADSLDSWIQNGGQLVLATSRTWDIQNPTGNRMEKPKRGDYLERHQIYRRPGEGAKAVAASETRTVGKGRIIYLPDSHAFSNKMLRETDNAVWLATRVSEWGNGVLFDEYHQGFASRRGFFSLIGLFLFGSPWGFLCLQLGLAGAIYIVGCNRRFGKIIEEPPVERTSPIEAAEALGGLFQTAQARVLSTRAIHQYLNMRLSVFLGHRVDLSNPESRERIARRSGMDRARLDAYAQTVAGALEKPADKDAELVQIARSAANILRSLDHGSAASRRHAAAS